MKSISGVIITFNEEDSIRSCLESLSFVDEIIVVDSSSTDNTVAIAREYTDKVFSVEWTGYATSKNYGIDQSSNDWILSLDADERISETLRKSIEDIDPGIYSAFRMPRKTFYLGRGIHGGGWYPDKNIRLFNKRHGRFNHVSVHESVKIQSGKIGELAGDILHYSYRDISDHVRRIDKYSNLIAENWNENDRCVNRWNMVFRPVWEFFRSYIFRRGFRDGTEGLILAGMHAFYTFLKYVKTYEKRLRNN